MRIESGWVSRYISLNTDFRRLGEFDGLFDVSIVGDWMIFFLSGSVDNDSETAFLDGYWAYDCD